MLSFEDWVLQCYNGGIRLNCPLLRSKNYTDYRQKLIYLSRLSGEYSHGTHLVVYHLDIQQTFCAICGSATRFNRISNSFKRCCGKECSNHFSHTNKFKRQKEEFKEKSDITFEAFLNLARPKDKVMTNVIRSKNYAEHIEELILQTSFLQNNPSLSSRVKALCLGADHHPKCECGKPVSFCRGNTNSRTF